MLLETKHLNNYLGDRARYPFKLRGKPLVTAYRCRGIKVNKNAVKQHDCVFVLSKQRHDKGRGRKTAERQVLRTEKFRHAARGGNAFFGRGGQNCVDEVRGEVERQGRKFCSGKGGKMINFVVLPRILKS